MCRTCRGAPLNSARSRAERGGNGQSPGHDRVRRGPETGSLICIGASTGGITALEKILPGLPADCPPTLVVQHIRGEFLPGLVDRIDRMCPARIRMAENGSLLEPGSVLVAPGNSAHLVVAGRERRHCRLQEGPPRSGHIPSVDMLFESAAQSGLRVTAALLTGMGRDGAEGLGAIRRAGGQTIAQDEDSCTVYGMPRAAIEMGAADYVVPLRLIGAMLFNLSTGKMQRTGADR